MKILMIILIILDDNSDFFYLLKPALPKPPPAAAVLKREKVQGCVSNSSSFRCQEKKFLLTDYSNSSSSSNCRQMDCSGLLLLLISYSGFCWRQNLSKCLHKIGNGSWNHTFLSGLWHGIQNLSLSSLGVLTRQDSCVLDGKCTSESARSLWSYLWSLSWYWWFTIAAGMKSCLFDS